MLTEALAAAVPPITEDTVDAIHLHEFLGHLSHELEVHGSQGAGNPQIRIGPVAALAALFVDGDPVGVRIVDGLVRGMRISARDHVHSEFAAALHEVAKRIAIAEKLALVMQGTFVG